MEFRNIKPEDKSEYEKHYKYKYRMASDASFATTYSWAEGYGTTILMQDGVTCLKGKSYSPTPYFMMPQGPGDRAKFLRDLFDYCHDEKISFSLHWALKEDLSLIDTLFGSRVQIASSRDSADYIYETKSLLSLSGKKLHAKRNHVNAFKTKYAYSISEINETNIHEACEFVLKNCKTEEETIAMTRLFSIYFSLGLTGMILYVDNCIAAVTVGEKITEDTVLIHLEKADTSYQGAYPAVNQLFITNYFSNTVYVNREEDMGIEGLRKAKLSYHPIFLLEKFTVTEAL